MDLKRAAIKWDSRTEKIKRNKYLESLHMSLHIDVTSQNQNGEEQPPNHKKKVAAKSENRVKDDSQFARLLFESL